MNQTCSFEGCDKVSHAKNLCAGHYQQQRAGKDMLPLNEYNPRKHTLCTFEGCNKPHAAKGLCKTHYDQKYCRGQELRPIKQRNPVGKYVTCTFLGCDKPHVAKGLCAGHYDQQYVGKELRPIGLPRETDCCLLYTSPSPRDS